MFRQLEPTSKTPQSQSPRGQLTSTPIKWGVWKGELSGVWGGGHPRQHDHSTHHTPATISHKSGVAKKQAQVWCLMTALCGDAILACCSCSIVLFQREAVYSLFSKGMAHFDTHQLGCVWKGGLSGAVERRAPALTQSRFTPRNPTQQSNSLCVHGSLGLPSVHLVGAWKAASTSSVL